jgi:hypothetical protein
MLQYNTNHKSKGIPLKKKTSDYRITLAGDLNFGPLFQIGCRSIHQLPSLILFYFYDHQILHKISAPMDQILIFHL